MIKKYVIAKSLEEAKEILEKEEAKVVGGGTWLKFSKTSCETLVDITRIGLNFIQKNGVYKIGSTTTIEEIKESEVLKKIAAGLVNKHAAAFYPYTLRNLATIGGNIVPYFPLSDMAPVLLSLDAKIKTTSGDFDIYDFLKMSRGKTIGKKSILTEILIPEYTEEFISNSFRFSQLKNEFAWIIGIINIIPDTSKTIKDVRIVVSACTRRPTRLKTLEEKLKSNKITDAFLQEVRKSVRELKLILDRRASIEYRIKVLENLLVNAFEELKKSVS
ncbi:MAG: FAD binding domain-containing protein [bacterium]|nr:FAD binding domain-containing protein [bacterium]